MTFRAHSIVETLLYDDHKNRVKGVRVIDALTHEVMEFEAKVIFMCASTLATTGILLRSSTGRFPDGLGNSSGVLGRYLMDHHKNVGGSGVFVGLDDRSYKGFRPGGLAIPRFVNLNGQEKPFFRGYGFWGGASRGGLNTNRPGLGEVLKKEITQQGPWRFSLAGYGACLPYYENKVELDPDRKDQWGLPLLRIEAEFKENEMEMRKDMEKEVRSILEAAGLEDISTYAEKDPVHGDSVHEMGTARMGRDPETSFLNGYNQSHEIPNLFITDGSAMSSSGHSSPSLTYMALTARACDYAVKKLKKGEL